MSLSSVYAMVFRASRTVLMRLSMSGRFARKIGGCLIVFGGLKKKAIDTDTGQEYGVLKCFFAIDAMYFSWSCDFFGV